MKICKPLFRVGFLFDASLLTVTRRSTMTQIRVWRVVNHRVTTVVLTLLAAAVFLDPAPTALAQPAGFSPCPPAIPATTTPPGGEVTVTVLDIRPNTDLEPTDDYIPFYDNKADIYGTVEIAGESFSLPRVDENDHPHWGASNGRFTKTAGTDTVSIKFAIREYDSGLEGGDDTVDVTSDSSNTDLSVTFDLCKMVVVMPDGTEQGAQGVIESAGTGSEGGRIRFKVELADGRPVTTDDIALVEVDMVQVIHQTPRLIADKPTVMLLRVANNFSSDVNPTAHVTISGADYSDDERLPLGTIAAGEVASIYLFTAKPIRLPEPDPASIPAGSPDTITVTVDIDPDGALEGTYDADDCRRQNNGAGRVFTWKRVVVEPPEVLWARTGLLSDIGDFVDESAFDTLRENGRAFIRGVYPIPDFTSDESPVDVLPPLSAGLEPLLSVFSNFGIPLEAAEPFIMLFELNSVTALTGYDRMICVVPNDWFEGFSYGLWEDVIGVSLGEFGPHAVLCEAGYTTVAAHELGHTYGLSTDPTIKNVFCNMDLPYCSDLGCRDLMDLVCGALGGFDEYEQDDSNRKVGNPAHGFWVEQGDEPSAIDPMVNKERCDGHCLMGNGDIDLSAPEANRWVMWIEAADYDLLIDKLSDTTDPDLIYVSGMISYDNKAAFGNCYRWGTGNADSTPSEGLYAVRFVETKTQKTTDYNLPVQWLVSDVADAIPVTTFGLRLPWPSDLSSIQIVNRETNAVLAERVVSDNPPTVTITCQPRAARLTAVRPAG